MMAKSIKKGFPVIAVFIILFSIVSSALGSNFMSSAEASTLTSQDQESVQPDSRSGNVPNHLSLIPSEQGVNINNITNATITITSGDTYIYTVDTPEGEGRTTLAIKTVEELLKQITSKINAPQTYT